MGVHACAQCVWLDVARYVASLRTACGKHLRQSNYTTYEPPITSTQLCVCVCVCFESSSDPRRRST